MNAHTYNAPTISAGTIARTACLLLADAAFSSGKTFATTGVMCSAMALPF